jgi:hypothetical protein
MYVLSRSRGSGLFWGCTGRCMLPSMGVPSTGPLTFAFMPAMFAIWLCMAGELVAGRVRGAGKMRASRAVRDVVSRSAALLVVDYSSMDVPW